MFFCDKRNFLQILKNLSSLSDLSYSLEANSPNPLMYQAENRFPEEGETFKVTALVNIDSRIQMVHVV